MTKNIKRIFFVTALILLLVSISAISATEATNDTSSIAQQDVVKEVNVEKVSDTLVTDTTSKDIKKDETVTDLYVSDTDGSDDNSGTNTSPFKTIQTALDKTSSDGTYNIHILEGTYKGIGNTNLTVNGNNTINLIGDGINKTILDGEANYTIPEPSIYVWESTEMWWPYEDITGNYAMTITEGNSNITISNLNIEHMICNGTDNIGGWEHAPVDNYGNLFINNVKFYYNCAGVGSAIRNNNGATLIVNNSLFEENRKSSSTGNDGIIYNNGTATITNSNFNHNYARWGTILNDNIIILINDTLSNGIAYDGASTFKYGSGFAFNSGGSDFYNPGNLLTYNEVYNCTFINNDQTDIYGIAGSFIASGNKIINSTGINLDDNTLNENITYLLENNTINQIVPSTLSNSLSSGSSLCGIRARITNNSITINNNNITMKNGTAISLQYGVLKNNTISLDNGTAIYIANNSNVESNILNQMIIIDGTNNILTNNNITTNNDYTITLNQKSTANTIKENYLQANIRIGDKSVKTNRQENTIENNYPSDEKNIYVSSTQTTAQEGDIDNPTTLTDAITKVTNDGCIILFDGEYLLEDTIHINPTNTEEDTKTFTIKALQNSTINGNNKQIINITPNYNINIENIKFTNANAENGGAINTQSNINITNCEFIDNRAITGAAIYATGNINIKIENNTFTNNNAEYETIYLDTDGEKTLKNNIYKNNSISTTTTIQTDAISALDLNESATVNIILTELTNPTFYDENITNANYVIYENNQLINIINSTTTSYEITSPYPNIIKTYIIPEFTQQASNNLTIEFTYNNKIKVALEVNNVLTYVNETATITVSLKDNNNYPVTKGTISYYEGENLLSTTNVENGVATYTTPVLENIETKTITIKYTDNTGTYRDNQTTIMLTVTDGIYVSPTVTEANIGSQDNPTTITDALSRIQDGKTIYLLEGTYEITQAIKCDSTTTSSTNFNIIGINNPTIDAKNTNSIMQIANGYDITIKNITLTNTNNIINTQFSAISISNSTVNFENCILSNFGLKSGINIQNSNTTITNTLFINNQKRSIEATTSTIVIQNSNFINNIGTDFLLSITNSNITITSSNFENITTTANYGVLSYSGNNRVNKNITITNNTFKNIKSALETLYVNNWYPTYNITNIENNTYENCTISVNYNIVLDSIPPVQVGDTVKFNITTTGLTNPTSYDNNLNLNELLSTIYYRIFLNNRAVKTTEMGADKFEIISDKSDLSTVYINNSYGRTSNTITFESELNGLKNTIITVNPLTSLVENTTLEVIVKDRNNTLVEDCGKVYVYKNSILIGEESTINGTATITTTPLTMGTHTLTICYNDTSNKYNNQTTTTTITLGMQNVYVSSTVTQNKAGTLENPTTITDALGKVGQTGNIYFLNGTYNLQNTIVISTQTVKTNANTFNIIGLDEVTLTQATSYIIQISANNYHINISNINFKNANQYAISTMSEMNINNCTFENNKNSAVQVATNNLTIQNSRFINNSAKTDGGAIFGAVMSTIKSYNNIFINNTATRYGGAINSMNNLISFNDTFINCSSTNSGGAIYEGSYSQSYMNVSNSTFENCKSQIDSGAVYFRATNITLTNNTFKNIYSPRDTNYIYPVIQRRIVENNTYYNCSIEGNFTVNTEKENIDYNEPVTLKINITPRFPNYYDANLLENLEYQIFINNENKYNTTETELTFTPEESGTLNIYVTTTLLNRASNNITINIIKKDIIVDPITATAGETINITARITVNDETMTDLSKGKVTFKVNGKTLKDANGKVIYAKVINGTATIENYLVPDDWAKEGTTIQAVYSGSTQCEKLTSEKTNITVTPEELTLTTTATPGTPGQTTTLTATLSDNTINTGKIVFKINGKTVKDANGKVIYAKVTNGTVSVDYTLPESYNAGNYTVTATFIAPGYDRLEANTTMTIEN